MAGLTVAFSPLLGWPVLVALAFAAAALVAFSLWRRARGTWLRALALSAVLLALANPSVVSEERKPLKDVAFLVVDATPSQNAGDRRARLQDAVSQVQAAAAGFERDLDLRVVTVEHDSLAAAAEGTRLLSALARAAADVPARQVAGAIVVTDGQIHDATADASGLPGPVHVLLTGERDEQDRRLTVVEAPSYGIVGKEIRMTLRVDDGDRSVGDRSVGDRSDSSAGGPAGRALLTVRRDGADERRLPIPVGRDVEVEVALEHAGPTVFELSVGAGPNELTLENNRAVVSINGVRDRLRVLLVSGEPHSGERVWRNLLKSDPSVDLIHFTILRPPEKQDGTPINELSLISFPTRELFEVKLHEFDLIIFDRYRRRGVLPGVYFDNVVDYVNRGGALLEASGPTFASPFSLYRSPLGEILPGEPTGRVIEGGYRAALTDVGRRHPVTSGLPGSEGGVGGGPAWGPWFRQIDITAKRGHTVLSGAEGRPLLILDRYGEGRVAQLNSDHIWLWSRGYEGGGPQRELLRRVAHWLMREPDLEENDLRATVRGAVLEIVRRDVEGENVPVALTAPDGTTRVVTLTARRDGEYAADVPVDHEGLYRVEDGTRIALAAAGALNSLEMADIRTTERVLQPVVAAAGGSFHWLADGVPDIRRVAPQRAAGGRGWLGLVRNGDYVLTGVTETPLLPPLLIAAVILGLLALTWQREAR